MSKILMFSCSFLCAVLFIQSCQGSLTVSRSDNQIFSMETPTKMIKTNETINYTLEDDCNCFNTTCKCCLTLDVPEIGIYFDGCGKMKFDPNADTIELMVTINDKVIIDEKLSAHDPPPVCIGKPFTLDLADFCIRLYDIDYSKHIFKGCSRLEGRIEDVEVLKVELGCWNLFV